MNGRLLRQALFSTSEPESHSPSVGTGAARYAQPARDSLHSPQPRDGTSFFPRNQATQHELYGTENTQASSPTMASTHADDMPLTDHTMLPFSANAANLTSRGPQLRISGQQNSSDMSRSAVQQRKSRAFSQTRPARSLHQRLDPDDSQDPPSYPAVIASDHAVQAHFMSGPRRLEEIPRIQSRSASVLSSVHGRPDDDLSSIMMRGATDLRHAKFELEEQRRAIALLQSQMESLRKEKEELSQRLKNVKDSAKQGLQTSSKSLEALRLTMDGLKAQSESSFAFVSDARSSLVDVQTLRATISTSIQGIEPYIEGGEEWTKVRELKSVMSTLESECSKSQQVADLLRDRLQSVGGDLVEAKNRVTELETAQAEDRAASARMNTALARTSDDLSSLMECSRKQQGELYDTLAIAAESEAKAQAATVRIQELQELLQSKEEALRALETVRPDVARLQAVLEEKDMIINKLENEQMQIPKLRATANELEITVAQLTTLASGKDVAIADREDRLRNMEAELGSTRAEMKVYVDDLGATKTREQTAATENERLQNETRTLAEKIGDLEATLARARQELENRSERLQEANLRFQALEDRFEDQSVTLRMTREAAGDAQERLLTAETTYAKQLADVTAKLEQEIAVLQEQKLGSQATVDVLNTALKRHERTLQLIQEEHADRLKEQSAAHAERLLQAEKREQQLVEDLADSRARISSFEANVRRLEDEIVELRHQLKDAQLPSPETEAELRTLRSRVATLEAAEMMNTVRAKTIESRYRTGDLNDEEKAFINTLVRTSQAIHEQDLVSNRNELRRRDNALKEMRAKVHMLEGTLAKHLHTPKAKLAPPTVGDKSMIDPAAWMSSGQSSSPVHAPDRDGQLDVDVVVPAKKPTNIPHQGSQTTSTAQADLAQPIAAHIQVQTLQAPVRKTPQAASTATKKANFSRLATDCSDEILDFDDEHGARKPSPTSSLGKRNKASSPPQQPDGQAVHKPLKRLRTTARKADVTSQDGPTNAAPKKAVQPSSSKNSKARKRR